MGPLASARFKGGIRNLSPLKKSRVWDFFMVIVCVILVLYLFLSHISSLPDLLSVSY